MALILALLECFLIGAAACATIHLLMGSHAGGAGHLDGALQRALTLSLSCAVAFYYQELYDLHAVRTFRNFLSRLPRSAVLALVLTLAAWGLILTARVSDATASLVLPSAAPMLLPGSIWTP